MTCPDCGHANMDGLDACEHCGQDLRSIDIPRPTHGLQRRIMETPLKDLDPATALTVAPSDAVFQVIAKMKAQRLGSALVVDRGRLVGIFTERDALEKVAGRRLDTKKIPVRDVMTPDPTVMREDDTLARAMHQIAVAGYRHLPVVDEGKPLRFISVRGVLRYLNDHAR